MSEIRCREASVDDAATIVEYQEAMALETENIALDHEVCTRGVRAVFEDPSRGRYFVATHRDVIVGSLLVTTEWSDWRAGTVWWIQSVYVRPELRGRGVYRTMYDHIRRIASSDPTVRGVRLYVDRRNVPAQRVYARLGMDGDHYVVFEWMKPES